MKIVSALLLAITCSYSAFSQSTGLHKIKLIVKVTDANGNPLSTELVFQNTRSKSSLSFTTNKTGEAECLVPYAAYTIASSVSDDVYDIDLSKVVLQELPMNLQFNTAHFKPNKATPTHAVIGIRCLGEQGVRQLSVKATNGKIFSAKADSGTVFIKVPISDTYQLFADGIHINNSRIVVDGSPMHLMYHVLQFSDKSQATLVAVNKGEALIYLNYADLYDKPAANELLIITSKRTGKTITAITGKDGTCMVTLPQNDHYNLSLKYYEDFLEIPVEQRGNSFISNEVVVRFPSSLQIEEEKKEEARRIAERDSIYRLHEKSKERDALGLYAEEEKNLKIVGPALKTDDKYFEKVNNAVCAVLYRNRVKWKKRTIVTDVTGSMYPYMREVALWHMLEMMEKQPSDYLFFNDGDNMPDDLKVIGKTGGLYFIKGVDAKKTIEEMMKAMNNGNGGDGPENNIEAALKAEEYKGPGELVMVVDNYSNVKDIALLKLVKSPVHIVLCGASVGVNTDYLQIAWQTGGSIHTIERDIEDLSSLHDHELLTIGDETFQFVRGRFFKVNKKI